MTPLHLLPILFLACPAPPQDATSPPDSYLALVAEAEASESKYQERYEAFRPRFEALAEAKAGTDLGLRARLWLFREAWWEREAGTMPATARRHLAVILREHADSPRLAELIDSTFVLDGAERPELCRRLLELSPHATVKAAALLGLGREELRSREPEAQARATAALERLARDFGALPYKATSYAAMAEALLHPLAPDDLAVGQVAPEIAGADLDGHPLKLSDFRGKVVVLDFWGDW